MECDLEKKERSCDVLQEVLWEDALSRIRVGSCALSNWAHHFPLSISISISLLFQSSAYSHHLEQSFHLCAVHVPMLVWRVFVCEPDPANLLISWAPRAQGHFLQSFRVIKTIVIWEEASVWDPEDANMARVAIEMAANIILKLFDAEKDRETSTKKDKNNTRAPPRRTSSRVTREDDVSRCFHSAQSPKIFHQTLTNSFPTKE
jgi:hypothetical protein